ncbi:hypothetical protein QHC53_003413 [Salmonella enterica]|uniref:Lipoprotein n=1 Tax=Salmonella enterica subsp. enterica serovar Typhi str. CT18 TaxID=220341 RepID=A0A716WHG4_SALTI|nr:MULTISPECIES: hypothetical protein [Citrobacter]EDL4059770.1 hypothetical protein [Salmonella enterica subsp. enterica serovar Infantis]EEI4529342.1 hypothetical protein [Salmonella enterica]HAD5483756.1 hypothetical protein [Salmonella enterica subsp. enterica serovar Typhi str. CT18]EKY4261272.1 hypothetical protein [Salmonella enterica]MDM3355192.1 hypothetical protein [Citrobacter sp. Cb004]
MKTNKSAALLVLLLAGCAQQSNPQQNTTVKPILTQEISPASNVESKAKMGDLAVYNTLVSTLKTDMVTLGNASGSMSEIKAGNYCHVGGGVYRNFEDPNAVGLKTIAGQVVSHTDSVKYDKAKNTISPPNTTTFDATEISIKFTQNAPCHVVKKIVQSISYNGKSGDDLKFIYSESYPGLDETKTEFSVPLSDAKTRVEYKNLAFKIVEMEGTTIRYYVLPSGNK